MYGMVKEMSIDLGTITRAQIETDNLPCISIKQAVDANLLPRVRNYEKLDKGM